VVEDSATANAQPQVCYNDPGQPVTGLVLTGGGARAAYQVGVLKAISDLVYNHQCGNPFPIIAGTSAGAINGTVLAAYAMQPRLGVKSLEKVWANFSVEQVFRADFAGLSRNSLSWLLGILGLKANRYRHTSLLDNTPLKHLLGKVIRYDNIQKAIDAGRLRALCVTCSGYDSGQSVSFFQGAPDVKPWRRYRRSGCRDKITRRHLLASSAIPLIFPPKRINREFFGDGSVRFLAPISPAIHLGADRILVVGVDPIRKLDNTRPNRMRFPSIADIAGHVLDSVFIDSLDSDLERIHRINQTIKLIPEQVRALRTQLRPIETLVISPSQDLSALASKHFQQLPAMLRFLFNRIGINEEEGSTVLSYLLFEASYTGELLQLGYQDAMQQAKKIVAFFAPQTGQL